MAAQKNVIKKTGVEPDSPPQISDAEWIVMKVVWSQGAATANQVVGALKNQKHWKPKTIQTLLVRLSQKGVLDVDRSKREYVFRPLVEAKNCLSAATRSFLGRFFDGELAPFLACFLETEKLSAKEIEELKRILNQKKS